MVRTTALVIVAVLVATCIMAPVSAELGRSRSSMLGFTDFIANHDEYNAYVYPYVGTYDRLPLATKKSIDQSNQQLDSNLVLFKQIDSQKSQATMGTKMNFNGKEYTKDEQFHNFHQMDGLEIDILRLKKQIETAKSPEQKTKLQAELKAKEDRYVANMWINGFYFQHKVDQLVKLKVEELENLLNQIHDKYQPRIDAADASGDMQAIEKIEAEHAKELLPITAKLHQSEVLKRNLDLLHEFSLAKSSQASSKAGMQSLDSKIAASRSEIARLEFRLSDADMAQINLWMAKPWIDLTTN